MVPDEGSTPVAPVLYPRLFALEVGKEGWLGLDGDDAAFVQPDFVEDECEEVALLWFTRIVEGCLCRLGLVGRT